MSRRRHIFFLILLFALLHFPFIGLYPLWNRDDSRRAEIAREMLELKDFVVPHVYYVPYLEKPILNTYFIASSLWFFGLNEFGARFWIACFSIFAVLFVYGIGVRMYSSREAFWAAFFFGTCLETVGLSRFITIDIFLVVWILGGYYASLRYFWDKGEHGEWSYPALWGRTLAVFLALSVLTKGFVGLVVVGMPLFLYFLFMWPERGKQPLTSFPYISFFLLFFLILLPWHLAIYERRPEFFTNFYWRSNIEAFFNKEIHHAGRFYDTFWFVLVAFLPWTPFALLALCRLRKKWLSRKEPFSMLFFWFLFGFLFFTIAAAKSMLYIYPLLPLLALFTGYLLCIPSLGKAWQRGIQVGLTLVALSVFFGGLVGLTYVEQVKKLAVEVSALKGIVYALSLVFFLGAILAWTWLRAESSSEEAFLVLGGVTYFLWLFLSLALPFVSGMRSSKYAILALKKILRPEDKVYTFHDRDYAGLFYWNRPIPHIGAVGRTIEYGARLKPRPGLFLPYDAVPRILQSKQRVFIITYKKDFYKKFFKRYPKHFYHILFVRGNYMVLSNRPLSAREREKIGPFYSSSSP